MRDTDASTLNTILNAAFDALNDNPQATLADIARRAGIGRATLHRHVSGREDLIRKLARTAMQELEDAVDSATQDAPSYTEGLRLAMAAMIPLATRQWFLATDPITHDPEFVQAMKEDRTYTVEAIEAARREGTFSASMPTHWIAETYDALTYAAWTMVRDGEATPRQAADLAWTTFMNGTNPK